jgi:hypothetical protein
LHLVEVHQVVVLVHKITVTQMVLMVVAVEVQEHLVRELMVELVQATGIQVAVAVLVALVEAIHLLVVQEQQTQS